ncbi:substrate-binding periplasmic protein [Pseudodesulfovibrio sp.]|uniref:substrate-binding periplasmic protein n=1 Tax=unclassified Pseudodesulfovibrio TaxID=2661612 RepID=UPI003B0060AD
MDFPPYYFVNGKGEPDGSLLRLARRVFERAEVPIHSWQCLPAKRVLSNMQSDRPIVSIGWFKTPERERVYRFSRCMYKNKQLNAVYLKKNANRFEGLDRLADLLNEKTLRVGLLDGYSLGPVAESIIKKASPNACRVVGGYDQLIRMLAEERFSYIVVAPESLSHLLRKNHLEAARFVSKHLVDIKQGICRYLMYSRAVPDKWVRRIDRALDELVKE